MGVDAIDASMRYQLQHGILAIRPRLIATKCNPASSPPRRQARQWRVIRSMTKCLVNVLADWSQDARSLLGGVQYNLE